MANSIPPTMRALVIDKFCKPSDYNIATLPTPTISKPDEILIKVYAASLNPVDVKLAAGLGKNFGKVTIGYDLSGVVVAIGTEVTKFKVGDEVYSRLLHNYRGSIAEYALSSPTSTELKPKSLTFSQAAAVPLAGMTALQSLDRGEEQLGTLRGKTVYIPGGLSGTGSFAVQIAKNVFGAGKVITTLSPGKIVKAKELLGAGTPDQIIDYTKENVKAAIGGKGVVDFMFDPVAGTMSSLSLMKKDGVIVSISTVPSGSEMKGNFPDMAGWFVLLLNVIDGFIGSWASWNSVRYSYLSLQPAKGDLKRITQFCDEGKVIPIIGRQVKMEDVEAMRKGCQEVYDGKGGVGKFVIDIL